MRCKGSAKGMKHKINFILFSNLFLLGLFGLFTNEKLSLRIFLSLFMKKVSRSFGSSRKSANFALAIRK